VLQQSPPSSTVFQRLDKVLNDSVHHIADERTENNNSGCNSKGLVTNFKARSRPHETLALLSDIWSE
jgi:hypothetical protein